MSELEGCNESVLNAQLLMNSTSGCQEAITKLEAETAVCGNNARYIITLASAYGCKAGYNTSTFFASDLPLFSTAGANVLGGLTTFSTSSSMDAYDNDSYVNLKTATNLLLYAGGIASTTEPTVARRNAKFTSLELADIHSLLSYFLLVQMGKYLYYYGDSSGTGVKGSGPQANTCLANYDDANAVAWLGGGVTGGCVAGNGGHADLGATGSLNVGRMCEGVTLMNNFNVVFPAAIDGFSGDEFGSLDVADLAVATAALRAALVGFGYSDDIVDTLNYGNCVSDYTADDTILQIYFAMVFETLFI